MTPWRNRESREPGDTKVPSDMPMSVTYADIEDWLDADADARSQVDVVLDALMVRYLAGGLSATERQLVEERLRTDANFSSRAMSLTEMWNLPEDADPADLEARYLALKELFSEIEHVQQGFAIFDQVDRAFITDFLAGELSSDDERWVEYRLGSDAEFRELAEPLIREWGVPLGFGPDVDLEKLLERVHGEHTVMDTEVHDRDRRP